MNTVKRIYMIYGTEYFCYFYNNGYDTGVNVFSADSKEALFRFEENVNDKEIVYLLKGYHIGQRKTLPNS